MIDDEIRKLIEDEMRRGSRRRPIDSEELDRKRKLRHDLIIAFQLGDERNFLRVLREFGLKDESPEFQNAWKVFRAETKKHG